MLDQQELEAVVSGGYELRGYELKGAGLRSDGHLFGRVTGAALRMGNLRDGGQFELAGYEAKAFARARALSARARVFSGGLMGG